MARLVLVENGVVTRAVVGDPDDDAFAGWINVTVVFVDGKRPGIGWTYSGGTFAPPTPATPARRKVLTGLEWVETWTADEWRALKTAAAGGTAVAKRLDQLLDAIRLTGSFNLESATAVTFYNFLESNGYIDAARRAELTQGVL